MENTVTVYCPEYREDIVYNPDDLLFGDVDVIGYGYRSGRPYILSFDDSFESVTIDIYV